ncbi:MAG: hypothetical protein ACTSQY_07110 [Candidatus Odinarchaeia archaeon]
MDIRDFNSWLEFKEVCKERQEEKCALKNNGLCIYVLCPLKKLDRDFDDLSLITSLKNRNNGNGNNGEGATELNTQFE